MKIKLQSESVLYQRPQEEPRQLNQLSHAKLSQLFTVTRVTVKMLAERLKANKHQDNYHYHSLLLIYAVLVTSTHIMPTKGNLSSEGCII